MTRRWELACAVVRPWLMVPVLIGISSLAGCKHVAPEPIGGVAWRQMRVMIRLRDTTCTPDTWDRLGQIDAMGSVLWAIVHGEIPIGSKGRLELCVDPAGVEMDWFD